MSGPRLRTKRLRLDPFAESEADGRLEIFRDPVVRRFLLDGSVVSRAWVVEEIRASRAAFATGGAGLWSLRPGELEGAASERDGSAPIVGFVGFRRFPEFAPPELQLLHGLRPAFPGRRLATEAARRVAAYALDVLGWREVWAAVDVPNRASTRVLDRIGMVLDGTTDEGRRGTAYYVLRRSGGSRSGTPREEEETHLLHPLAPEEGEPDLREPAP